MTLAITRCLSLFFPTSLSIPINFVCLHCRTFTQDFVRRRKLAVLLTVCLAVVMILLYRTLSRTGDSVQRSVIFDEDDVMSLRTSNEPRGESLNSNLRDLANSNSVPLNKGNIAQVQVLNKDSRLAENSKIEGKAADYPDSGVEIKPKNNVKDVKRESEVEPVGVGSEKASSQEVDGVKIDERIISKPNSALHSKNVVESGNKDLHHPDDGLYVHSSMPLGPALKMPHTERQRAVVDAIKHAWSSYKKYAWGEDDLLPLSKTSRSTEYGMAMTMIDSLDTLWLVGLQEEFDEARNWIAKNLRFDNNENKVIVFEVNIRVVGGLLAAYHLSKDKMFLEKAVSPLESFLR